MTTNNRRFVNHIIRNVVQQNSIPDGTMPSPEAQFNLTKYFDDPNTVDLVFINMMERVRNERSHYEPVLSRILKLIKNNISLHPPSLQILHDLDLFCVGISPSANATLQKSISYIRALISNQIKQHPQYIESNTGLLISSSSSISSVSSHHSASSVTSSTLTKSSPLANNGITSSTGSNSSVIGISANSTTTATTTTTLTTMSNSTPGITSGGSHQHQPYQQHHQSNSTGAIGSSSSSVSGDRRASIGIVRTRSQSASTYISPRDDAVPSLLAQQQQQLQRSSLDLGNINVLSTSNNSSGGGTAVSSSTSTSSSPQSFNDSPIRNSLLNQTSSTTTSTPLSPTLTSNNNNNITQFSDSNNNNNTISLTNNTITNSISSGNISSTLSNLRDSTNNAGILSSSSSSNMTISPTLSRRLACQEDGYINDLMGLKCCPSKSISKNNKIHSLLTHSPFGVLKGGEIKGKDIFICPDDTNNMDPINIVQQTKKKDQEPLKISESEKQQVIKVINNPSTAQDRSIATKIFIKILLDIYCKHGVEGEKLIQSYFNSIIASPYRDARSHLFNIIFNLSIHINIYSELKLDDGSQGVIGDLQESVFSLLREVLLYCVKHEQDEKVWLEALTCIIFFVVDQGVVIRSRLHSLNSQIIAALLKYANDTSDQTKRMLIRMLCNFLYKDNNNNNNNSSSSSSVSNNNSSYMYLNEEELNNIGGIDFILRLYTTIRSNEAKNNLFVIIFDYVLQSALKSQTIADSQLTQDAPVLLELFKRADAPHYFVQLFKCIPERDFVSDFFLFTSADKNHESSFSYEDLTIKFSMKIHEHAVRYQKIDQSCEKFVSEVQDNPEKASALLQEWLFNENDELLRFNGAPDTNYSLFLNNQFVISTSLIKSINVVILQYVFSNITSADRYNETRMVLLHLLILRCNESEDLAKIGGISFFKNLMNDPCTPIAYHSSYFLLTQLEAESPEQYRSILQRLLSKARENNDENLISNPFFQVQGIIDMTHKT
ncbi:hypothetical protein PPL_09694 [Heterostelium album PN500]|uniref:Uncharacterized protein n=1 Tax=Heterostelium pallidum (strain ATCC 26659 / Pp 5 / PN500) TaxID=670386 RepID=D3BNJ1_HETP5|nr:hypothetical protein PPL_09694 [Heterostelium album PN500]EFA76942.1 hypothetical protein PPL_09694 [Heterostelium album PN500]|eukprot:XP_020429074.1 hypothetical protein PPL_09694 [Heterostelium album PN500]